METKETIVQTNQELKKNEIEEQDVPLNYEDGNIEITEGGSKPIFETQTKVKVISCILKTTKDKIESLDKKGNKQVFYPVYLNVKYKLNEQDLYENYGGAKLYISDETKIKKIWLGNDSALSKLREVVKNTYKEYDGTLNKITELILDKEVAIRTTRVTVAGKEYIKNLIEVIY